MKRIILYAFRNIWRSRVRTIALVTIISIGVAVLILIAAGYEDLFDSVTSDTVSAEGDMHFVYDPTGTDSGGNATGSAGSVSSNNGAAVMQWETYLAVKDRLLASGLVKDVRAETSVTGIIGGTERSAPCSGIAVENDFSSVDDVYPVTLGIALAKTLGVGEGDSVGGLVNDLGMTLKVEKTVKTEVLLKDRFYLEIPISVFLDWEDFPEVTSMHLWLKKSVTSPTLTVNSDSPDYQEILFLSNSIPELQNYTLYSIPKKNTKVEQIVQIYRTNNQVVLVVVALTLFLAFLNVLALSVYERQQELGTLRSMGTPISQIRLLIICETIMIALLSWLIGITVAIIGSVIIQARGGLVFAPPPGEIDNITIGSKLSLVNMCATALVVIVGASLAALITTAKLGSSSVVEQLEPRD
ncbi:MAG TPA: FtsX-like permease family protein [Treponema sp.]|nr:FtsX-like permease family protein [Treponema sp.]